MTVVDYAQSKGFQYVTDAAGTVGGAERQGQRPCSVCSRRSNMTTQFAPLIAAPTPGAGSPTTRCNEDSPARPASRASPP